VPFVIFPCSPEKIVSERLCDICEIVKT
jgi:hypothetical protein